MLFETVAYAENEDHEYIHVTTTDKSKPTHAFFSDNDRKLGTLKISFAGGHFEPDEWIFVVGDIPSGVYKRSVLGLDLLPNVLTPSFFKGRVIDTPHGKATILGFERFDRKGNTAPHNEYFLGNERTVCKLHEGHTWCFEGNYCMYPAELKEFNR